LLRPTDGLPVEGMEVHIEREGDSPLTGVSGADARAEGGDRPSAAAEGIFFRRRS
jgi:type VI secretion system secreted protein VgrG